MPKRRSKPGPTPRRAARPVRPTPSAAQPVTPAPTGPAAPAAGQPGPQEAHDLPAVLPVMPIRGTVLFPGTVLNLTVGRPASLRMLDESLPKSNVVCLVSQRDEENEDPKPDELYRMGVPADIASITWT